MMAGLQVSWRQICTVCRKMGAWLCRLGRRLGRWGRYFRPAQNPWIAYLLYPPLWLLLIAVFAGGGLTVAVFGLGWDKHPLAVPAYVLAAYALTAAVLRAVRDLPRWYRWGKTRVQSTKYGGLYLEDLGFRTAVSLYGSLAANLFYVALNALWGICYHTAWFGLLSGYYAILAVMRFLLVRHLRRTDMGADLLSEHRRARICGIILLTVNFSLSGVVLMILYQDRGYQYNGMLIYIMAAYTFYSTVHAIVDLVRYRKQGSPLLSMTKTVNLCAALVSMLALETAMLTAFGAQNSMAFRRSMVASTGGVISVILIALSLWRIIRANRAIRTARSAS